MTNRPKRTKVYLLDVDSKETVAEATAEILLIYPATAAGKFSLKGTLTIKGFMQNLNDKSYILQLNERVAGRVRLTMLPISIPDYDPAFTRFDIWFEDSAWHTSIDWFESL